MNFWDDDYPSGGNYWSDYTGVDTDGDGIGDTPYNITGGPNADHFPFMDIITWNNPPSPSFTYTPHHPTDTDIIHFIDTSTDVDGTIVSWLWDFGDGNTSTEQNPAHKYANNGEYRINLTVWDNIGANNTAHQRIVVRNVPPVADANGPYVGAIDIGLRFDGSGSHDIDGTIVSYFWDFGDGETGMGKNPIHVYDIPGTYLVMLTVTDDDGATHTNATTATILIGDIPPIIEITYPNEGDTVSGIITITGTSHDADGDETIDHIEVSIDHGPWNLASGTTSWSYIWDTTDVDDGGHVIFARSYDGMFYSSEDSVQITVDNGGGPLEADAHGPYIGYVGAELVFTGSALGGNPPYQWHWDFDDGNISFEQNPMHIYGKKGTYIAVLTVTDSKNNTANDTAVVTIHEDLTSPSIGFSKPENAFYFNNRKIMPWFMPIVMGVIDVEITASDDETGMKYVELYLNDELKENFSAGPYCWTWDERGFGRYTLKAVGYDEAGNYGSDEISVWKFF